MTDSAAAATGLADQVVTHGTSLSPSRAADFQSCPLKYRFRVIDRLPEPPSEAATRGTVVHAVLERLFDLPADQRTLEAAAALVAPEWARLLEAEPELAVLQGDADATGDDAGDGAGDGDLPAFLDTSGALLERYFSLEDPTRLEPADRELHVSITLDTGLTLRGYVDRLDRTPAGDMRVVDYKTGRAPGPGFESGAMFQMRFYALVLWKLHGVVPRMLQLLYLGSGEVLRYEPDEADLLATERKLEALWTAIRRATDAGDWRPRTSRLCDWCSYKDAFCPAWGGTPPPLPASVPVEVRDDDPEAPSTRGFGDDMG
jgi:putative RecB family exonuclease